MEDEYYYAVERRLQAEKGQLYFYVSQLGPRYNLRMSSLTPAKPVTRSCVVEYLNIFHCVCWGMSPVYNALMKFLLDVFTHTRIHRAKCK